MGNVKHHWCNGFNRISPTQWEMYISVSAPNEAAAYEWVTQEWQGDGRWMLMDIQTTVEESHYNYTDNGLNIYSFRIARTKL